jgi:hypothetical protein
MNNYRFELDETRTQCKVFKLSRKKGGAEKYLGTVSVAPGGRTMQNFAPDVCWLPVSRARAAMGLITQEQAILQELGV